MSLLEWAQIATIIGLAITVGRLVFMAGGLRQRIAELGHDMKNVKQAQAALYSEQATQARTAAASEARLTEAVAGIKNEVSGMSQDFRDLTQRLDRILERP